MSPMPADEVPQPKRWKRNWPDPKKGPWLLTMSFALSDVGVECFSLAMEPVDPGKRQGMIVTTRLLREIPIRRFAREYAEETAERFGSDDLLGWAAERAARTKRDLTIAHYRRVAAIYSAATARGDPPTRAVAEELGIKPQLAATWVKRARQHGVLAPATGQGKAGYRVDER